MNQEILYQAHDSVARITLNRPEKRNALNDVLIDELKQALRRADADKQVRVVVLSGAGSDFCSGADLATLQEISNASVSENLKDAQSLLELFSLPRTLPVPVVAAVRGRALAGGCGLALACDLVLAETSARFGFPEVKIAFVPAMVMAMLRRNVSEKRAFELIALGDEISASQAASIGLINHVFEPAEFEAGVQTIADRLRSLSSTALSLSKSLLYATDSLSFAEALAAGADINAISRMTAECRAGVDRFLKKRSR